MGFTMLTAGAETHISQLTKSKLDTAGACCRQARTKPEPKPGKSSSNTTCSALFAPLAAALFWVAPAQNASAAVLQYYYHGYDLSCPAAGCTFSYPPSLRFGWTGNLVVDESLLPGGTLSGLTLALDWLAQPGLGLLSRQLTISDQSGVLASYLDQAVNQGLPFDWSSYGILEATYGPILVAGVSLGHFGLTFDADKAIIAWSGSNDGLGSFFLNPAGTSDGIDRLGELRSTVPGVWSGPAPVPLPAALPLFATGLGVLGLLGWRRKRRAALAA